MKRTPSFLGTGLQQAALLIGLSLCQGLAQTATFTNTPTVVSNTYAGSITLQIGGLTNGETVVVQEFLDANSNGVIDATDWLVQQFRLVDGVASRIGGIVNSNVPGDSTPTNGTITAQMGFNNANPIQTFAGTFLLKLSSPGGHFPSLINTLTVTNLPYAQGVTGNIVCDGTNVPNAALMLFQGPVYQSGILAAVVADSAGGYSIKAPPGTYGLAAVETNYVQDTLTAPMVTLGGTTITNDVSLLPATGSISGSVVDAANPSRGVGGVLVSAMSDGGLMAISFTDTNGAFSLGVTSGQWHLEPDDSSLISRGYVGLRQGPNAFSGQTGVVIAVPRATALFYGSVKDAQGDPLPGTDVYANDENEQFATDGYSDANGNYWVGVVGGLSGDPWRLEISTDKAPANFMFSQAPFNQNGGGTNLSIGQTVRQDFVGAVATNVISGYLRDNNSNPIGDVNIFAQATISGADFHGETTTDSTGHYAIRVCNGSWTVGAICGGGPNGLGSQYLCPENRTVNIVNNDGVANFVAVLPTSQINGYVRDNSSNPIPNVAVYAYPTPNLGNNPWMLTDSSGHYSINVANGSWTIGVICCGDNSLGSLGFLCVGEQSTAVTNSTNAVNFTVSQAQYQITGRLRDAADNPIANVGVNADNGSYNACATSATDGSYTLYVTNSTWHVYPNCGALSSLGYLCPGDVQVTVFNANAARDLIALQTLYTISGWVRNATNQPFTSLNVYAHTTLGTNFYQSGSLTDSNGNYSLPVAAGQWTVGVDCNGLGSGYLCPDERSVTIAGASVVTNFTIQSCGALEIVTTSPLPVGQVGAYYSFYLQASGCYPPFSYWYVISGSLPPGLDLDSGNGEISGTPTTNGTFNFTVQMTDSNDTATNKTLSVTIVPPPGDVLSYSVTRMQAFRQLDAVTLVPDTDHGPFSATLSLIQSALDNVPIGNVYLPGGAVRGFPLGSSGIELQVRDYFGSQTAFDAVYTNGDYTFALATRNNGFQFPVLTLPAAAYPAAPRVTNFAAAQAISPSNSFTLQWSGPADATTNDVIWAFIVDNNGDTVFSTPYPATNHLTCLRGTDTSVVVPADTLQTGGAYTGVIVFFRVTSVNTTAYPGAMGLTLVAVDTSFPMAAPLAVVPVLSQPTWISRDKFGFLLSGTPGQNYTVLTSGNAALPLSEWAILLTTNLSGSSVFIQDNQATNGKHFYRVKVGP